MSENQSSDERFQCELNKSLEAITEMTNDDITDTNVKETLLDGEVEKNDRGPGEIFTKLPVTVVADNVPCHYYVITVWKEGKKKHSYKDKRYRKRRYMRRHTWKKHCSKCKKAELKRGEYPLEISGQTYGKFEGYCCPNCGVIYFTEESSKEVQKIVEKLPSTLLSVEDLSLILLYACKHQPIRGSISFMKEIFLLFKEKLSQFNVPALSPNFIPYHYGPYSFDVIQGWKDLILDGIVETSGRTSTNKETFRLTPEGERAARRIYDTLPKELRDVLPEWRRGLDELGNDGILKDVYLKYPEYTDKSKIRKKVLPMSMRGRA